VLYPKTVAKIDYFNREIIELNGTRNSTLLEKKRFYRTLKGSISATYLEPLKGSIHLKKGFLWVLYRTLGFHTWPIEPFTKKKKKWFYIESFWNGSILKHFGVPYGGWNHFLWYFSIMFCLTQCCHC